MPTHPPHPAPLPGRPRCAGRLAGLLAALVVAAPGSSRLEAQEAEKTAGETYRNVQVLKDAPASRFMNTMFFQRYALGVSCNHCHVGGAWAKDDKPAKLRAREMIRMVLTLNATVFKGVDGITCYTCHRGSTRPATDVITARIPLETMLNPRPPAARQRTVVPTVSVDSVIRRYLAALGGESALDKISSRMTKGSMITAEGSVVPFEEAFAAAPARWVSIRHFGPGVGTFSTGYDGAVAWNQDNRGTNAQREPNRSKTLMEAGFQTGRALASLYDGLTVTGTEVVGDEGAVVLSGVAKSDANESDSTSG